MTASTTIRLPVTATARSTRQSAGITGLQEVDTSGVSVTGEYRVNDMLTIKSITAYRMGYTNTIIDFDETPNPTLDVPAYYGDHQLTSELQALFTGDRWSGVAGIFYLDGSSKGAFDTQKIDR